MKKRGNGFGGLTGCICILAALLGFFAGSALAADVKEITDASGQWKYTLIDEGAVLVGWTEKPEGALVMPDVLDGHVITGIGKDAFYECKDLTGITLPNGLTSIGFRAFYNCESLTGITLPDSLMSIGNRAFDSCKSLTGITLPDGLISIGDYAFTGCSGLFGITLPDSLISIGTNPFSRSQMAFISVSADNPMYAQIDGVLYNKQQKMLVAYPDAREGAYSIPEGVVRIGKLVSMRFTDAAA